MCNCNCRPSFVLVILGFTSVAFVAGALSWWAPIYLNLGFELNPSPNILRNNAMYISTYYYCSNRNILIRVNLVLVLIAEIIPIIQRLILYKFMNSAFNTKY